MYRVEKTIQRAKEILPGKNQGEQHTEHGNGRNPLLLVDIASL